MKTMKLLTGFIVLIAICILMSGCSIGSKSWGGAGSADAFDISVAANPKTQTLAPQLSAGGACNAFSFQKSYSKDEHAPPMFQYSKRSSLWGIFSSDTSSSNISLSYIGGSNEKPADTVKILNAASKLINKKIECNISTDTKTDTEAEK